MKKIINSVGQQYESYIEIIELHDMIEFEAQEGNLEETPDLVELNSIEFFIKALLYFEEEANGQLSSSEPSPASLVRSETQRFDINAIKTALLEECKQCGPSKLLNDLKSTREEFGYFVRGNEGRTLDYGSDLLHTRSEQYCRYQ